MAETFLRVETTQLPPIEVTLDDVLGPSGDSTITIPGTTYSVSINPATWIAKWLKPKITVKTPFGTITKTPFGDPGNTAWPLLAIIAGVVAVTAVIGLTLYLRRRKRA